MKLKVWVETPTSHNIEPEGECFSVYVRHVHFMFVFMPAVAMQSAAVKVHRRD
jgi:hypothetical protein